MLPRGFCDECSPGTALNSAAAGSITRYPLGTMPDGELPSDLLQLMVHRLEAQERASARMMERANSYAVFSLAVLGFYVGILFARSDSPSALLLVGAGAIASLFLATLILFYRVHKAADLSVLPNPRILLHRLTQRPFQRQLSELMKQTFRSYAQIKLLTLVCSQQSAFKCSSSLQSHLSNCSVDFRFPARFNWWSSGFRLSFRRRCSLRRRSPWRSWGRCPSWSWRGPRRWPSGAWASKCGWPSK